MDGVDLPSAHPQRVMNVSIAQHPQLPFSDSWFDRSLNRGRGYDVATGINDAAQSRLGLNFQSQWDTAIKEKEKLNTVIHHRLERMVAQKLIINGKIYFVLLQRGILPGCGADEGRIWGRLLSADDG